MSNNHKYNNKQESDSEFSDIYNYSNNSENSYNSNINNPAYFLNKEEQFKNKNIASSVSQKSEINNFLSQYDTQRWGNTGDPSAFNLSSSDISNVKMAEMERNIALKGGYTNFEPNNDMTYGVINDPDKFIHTNMLPYHKSKINGSTPIGEKALHDYSQYKTDFYSGSANNPAYRKKSEVKKMFDPIIGATNIYSTPVQVENYLEYQNPSMYKQKEMPFQAIKITPGLNLSYNEVGKQGYHDLHRTMPKTVDDLRVANKQKVSYKRDIIYGRKGDNAPLPSKLVKKLANKFKEHSTKDLLKSLGNIRAPRIVGEYDISTLATKNRGVKQTPYMGHARHNTDKVISDEVKGIHRDSRKSSYNNPGPRNIYVLEGQQARTVNKELSRVTTRKEQEGGIGHAVSDNKKGYAYDVNNYTPDPTKRDISNKIDRAGNTINGNINKSYANNNIVIDPTIRDLINKFDRAGNSINGNINKSYVNNEDAPESTKRDILNKFDRAGNSVNGYFNKSYINNEDAPESTNRDLLNKFDRAGNSMNGNINKSYINNEDAPEATKRDILNKFNRVGNSINGNVNKGYVNNEDVPDSTRRDLANKIDRAGSIDGINHKSYINNEDILDPTKRDQTNKIDRAGKTINGNVSKSYVNNNDVPDPTIRDLINKFDRAGKTINGLSHKGYVNNEDAPDPTKRDMTNKLDRAKGGANASNKNSYVVNYENNIPDITLREIHNERKYINPAIGMKANKNRHATNNMQLNEKREKLMQWHKPTDSNYTKIPIANKNSCDLKDDDNKSIREFNTKIEQSTDRLNFKQKVSTKEKETKMRSSHIEINLKNNPYINNIIHKSNVNI